jgi:hypothetical protein
MRGSSFCSFLACPGQKTAAEGSPGNGMGCGRLCQKHENGNKNNFGTGKIKPVVDGQADEGIKNSQRIPFTGRVKPAIKVGQSEKPDCGCGKEKEAGKNKETGKENYN